MKEGGVSASNDILDPDVYLAGVPHETYTRLRRESPVFFHPEPRGPGFWAVLKHADVVAISRNPHTYSSHRRGTFIADHDEDFLAAQQQMMLNMDPPQHVRFRNLVKHAFVPRVIESQEPKIRQVVTEILDDVLPRGECDFVSDVAARLPLRVIAEMIGVPREDHEMLFAWSNKMIGFDDPEMQANRAEGDVAGMQMYQYAGELGQKRFDTPSDDLISVLMRGVADGGLTPFEFASFFMLLFVAGNETTRNATAGGMLTLLEHPDQLARLKADPSLTAGAVEEILRWWSPLVYFRRTATRDVELRGQKIRENDKVVMFYPSANRDEEVFADPFKFDIARTPNDHLAFGVGQHWCLGASLARMELRVMFEELMKRLLELELAGPVRRWRSNFINGIKSMPVRYRAERKQLAAMG
jgi:cholest-4-en-3-one 26-monooxygenase